jgi:hypothetical protein
VSHDVASYTKLKTFFQECIHIDGVEDASQLLSAFKNYRDDQDKIRNVLILSEKVSLLRLTAKFDY